MFFSGTGFEIVAAVKSSLFVVSVAESDIEFTGFSVTLSRVNCSGSLQAFQ